MRIRRDSLINSTKTGSIKPIIDRPTKILIESRASLKEVDSWYVLTS